MTVKYIGRYTKKPVIAETRILNCGSRWVIFRYKDYAEGGKPAIKKMGFLTFIKYLTQHIPDKHFRIVRAYGIFSNRLRGEVLPIARKLLGQEITKEFPKKETWRERQQKKTGQDPLQCEICAKPMQLVYACFELQYMFLNRLGIDGNQILPSNQFVYRINSS